MTSIPVNTATPLTVTVRDVDGNPRPGVAVAFAGTGTGNTLPSPGTSDANGLVTGNFQASGVGDHVLTFTVDNDLASHGVTVSVVASAVPDPAFSTLSAPVSTLVVGQSVVVTCRAKNSSNVNITSGGTPPVPTQAGGTATGTLSGVTDVGDGTYTWTWTATGAGTAKTLGATFGGVAISTTNPTCDATAPAAGGMTFNEPVGYTPLQNRPFITKGTSGSGRGSLGGAPNFTGVGGSEYWDDIEKNYANISISTVENGDPISGGSVLQFKWPGGTVMASNATFSPGEAQNQSIAGAAHGSKHWHKLYHRFAYKWSSNFQTHTNGDKICFHRTADNPSRTEPILGLDSSRNLRVNLQGSEDNNTDFGWGGGNLRQNRNAGTYSVSNMQKGVWHVFELQIELNSAEGVGDGIVRVWAGIYGVHAAPILVMEYTTLKLRRPASFPNGGGGNHWWDVCQFGQTWGGQGGTITNDMYTFLGHDYISGAT